MRRDEHDRALLGQVPDLVDRSFGGDQLIEAATGVEHVLEQLRRIHRRGDQARDRLDGEAIDPRIEVACDVPRHVQRDAAQRLVLALHGHAPDSPNDPAPVLELARRTLVGATLQPPDLVVGAVVEDQLGGLLVVVALHDPAHDFLHDVVALGVEPEDLGVVWPRHVGPQPGQSQGLARQELHRGEGDHSASVRGGSTALGALANRCGQRVRLPQR